MPARPFPPRPNRSDPATPAEGLPAHERPVGDLLAGLPRLSASAGLRLRCLEGEPVAQDVGQGPWRGLVQGRAGGWRSSRPLAYAAAALLALGTALLTGSSTAGGDQHPDLLRAGALASNGAALNEVPMCVVDDPSVPLFHGVETFQELALWQPSVAGGRGSR